MKTEKKQVGIQIDDGLVELIVDGSVFKLGLNERGLPLFPKYVKKQLPRYLPKMVRKEVRSMKKRLKNHAENLEIAHEYWCDELAGMGICRCNPEFRNPKLRDGVWTCTCGLGKLTCAVCRESSSGEIVSGLILNNYLGLEHLWTVGSDKDYIPFSPTTLICGDCLCRFFRRTEQSAA